MNPHAINGIEEIRKAAKYAGGWGGRLEELLGEVLHDAADVAASPIARALEGRFLPPGTEQAIAGMVTAMADEYERSLAARDIHVGTPAEADPISAGLPQPGSGTGFLGMPSPLHAAEDPQGANQV